MAEDDSLFELLEGWWDLKSKEVFTALPAIVESVDSATNTVTLKWGLKTKFFGENTSVEMPKGQDIPIVTPRTAGSMQIIPVKSGDIGLAVFSSRSISEFMAGQGQPMYPEDARQFDLSDAYFIPGGYPFGNPWPLQVPSDAIGQSLGPLTKMWFGGDTSELLPVNGVKDDLINWLAALTVIVTAIDARTVASPGAGAAALAELTAAILKRQVT